MITNGNTNDSNKENKMEKWINTLIAEKNISSDTIIEVDGISGANIIPLAVVVEHILIAPAHEQTAIKNMLVKIDFVNGDIMHFFRHLAKAIAI